MLQLKEHKNPITFKDVLEYILLNRGNKVFIGYNERQIMNRLREAQINNLLVIDTDSYGDLCGVVVAEYTNTYKVLHIKHVLCTERKSLRIFIREFLARFSGWRLTARRRGKFIEYDTNKLTRKILYND